LLCFPPYCQFTQEKTLGILTDVIGSVIQAATQRGQDRNTSLVPSRALQPRRGQSLHDERPYSVNPEPLHTSSRSYGENPDYQSYEQGVCSSQEALEDRQQFTNDKNDEPPAYSLYSHDAPSSYHPISIPMHPPTGSHQQHPAGYPSSQTPSMNVRPTYDPRSLRNSEFRLLVLPQIRPGNGEPFLRGYSSELSRYGISHNQFIQALDAINVARTPNPQAQLFQTGANIAELLV
jgi:hypothetical protein